MADQAGMAAYTKETEHVKAPWRAARTKRGELSRKRQRGRERKRYKERMCTSSAGDYMYKIWVQLGC